MDRFDGMWENFLIRLEESAQKHGWGDVANALNSIFGTHITAVDVMLAVAVGSPIFLITVLVVAYSKIGPRMEDRPGATGKESELKDLKEYVFPSRLKFFGARFALYFTGLFAFLFGSMYAVRVLKYGDAGVMPSDLLAGVSAGLATLIVGVAYPYRDTYMSQGGYILGYIKGLVGRVRLFLPREKRFSHILVNGPTGGGKTTGYVEPQLISDAMSDNVSSFVIDVKPDEDLIDNVAAAWTAMGKRVVYINPWDTHSHFSINPLLDCKGQINDPETYNKVAILVDAIFKAHEAEVGVASADASYFETQERDLLWGLIAALLEAPPEMRNLPTLYQLTRRPLIELLAFIANLKAPFVMREIQTFASMNDKQKNDFLSGLRIKLQVFGMPGVAEKFFNNDFDISRFFREPTLVVVKSPLDKPSSFKVATVVTRLMMMYHYREAKNMKKTGMTAFYYLDEFGSLRIPNITNVATTLRSSNGGLVILLHDRADLLSQGLRRAGVVSPQAMDSSLRSQIVIADSHPDTCEHYSRLMGRTAFIDREKMRNIFNVISFNFRSVVKEAPLMTPDEIKYMPEESSLIFLPNRRGIKLNQERVYERYAYKRFADMPYIVEEPDLTTERFKMAPLDESLFSHDGELRDIIEQIDSMRNNKQAVQSMDASPADVPEIGYVEPIHTAGLASDPSMRREPVSKLNSETDVPAGPQAPMRPQDHDFDFEDEDIGAGRVSDEGLSFEAALFAEAPDRDRDEFHNDDDGGRAAEDMY